ncbi:MAG TPA: hypothetical protein P5513_03660, partial [Candidatus Diapherotrites archaeon]|nr:hypothetical protein [Candidatus Diapherotrites archaeon]
PSSGEYNYTSKVKDIVYHITDIPGIEKFKTKDLDKKYYTKIYEGTSRILDGAFFTNNLKAARTLYTTGFTEEIETEYDEDGTPIPIIKDIKNPQFEYSTLINIKNPYIGTRNNTNNNDVKNNDSAILETIEEYEYMPGNFTNIKYTEYVVFEPEQIHILGSKQDIQGFKEFVQSKHNSVKPGVSELFESNPEFANEVYEALVPKGYTRLYRAENETDVDNPAPDWVKEQPEIKAQQEAQGRWFYKTYEEAKYHADKFGSSGISYIDVLDSEVESFNAKDNKFAGGYGKEGKEYFVSKELANNRKSFEQQKQQAQQLYSEYLDTIFPDSKVKDIVYHGTDADIEVFDKKTINSREKIQHAFGHGFYFTTSKEYAKTYGKNILSTILNIRNPKKIGYKRGLFGTLLDFETDYTISTDANIVEMGDEIVVFEPEQIHILGSKQDIQGFKEFVNKYNINQDLQNLHLTTPVLESLYENSSKSKDFITFVKDLKKMIAIWQNSGRTNEEILEMIKCL